MTPSIPLIAVALVVIALVVLAFTAPDGWQDADGFHFGTPSACERDEDRSGNVDAERDGRGLPLRVIDQLNHNEGISRG